MLEAGTLVCRQSSSRKRVSREWAALGRAESVQITARITASCSLACWWGSCGPGSVRASPQMGSLIGPGQPTPVARAPTPAADTRHLSHPLRLGCVDLQPHRCRRHASLGHWRILVMKKKKPLLGAQRTTY